ncbi:MULTISPECIES: hypothetical protein [unclassified Variovorax]|uniref:hypothetical protein n=1 Tax=unclassified Variovorax TaxID=663243 RepID=UPI001BD2D0CE|nr:MULTISPECIES: hypothetical protein [unclassified Variovorax]
MRAFDSTLKQDGYWLHASGFGYGYPMYGYGYGNGNGAGSLAPVTETRSNRQCLNARPGYEVRMLIASANILAQHGQQAACETVLTTTKSLYVSHAADLRRSRFASSDSKG